VINGEEKYNKSEVKAMSDEVEELIKKLKAKNEAVRRDAAEALGMLKDPRALMPLISALTDSDLDVRETVKRALNEIDPNWPDSEEAKMAVPDFISALKDSNVDVREAAAEALGEIKDARVIGPLISALIDSDLRVRWAAENALRGIDTNYSPWWGVVEKEEIDPDWAKSEEAKRQVPEFISALKHSDGLVRRAVAKALGEIKDRRAVEPLISALKDKDESVRWNAAKALGKLKDERAVEPLISALKDSNEGVRRAATKALEEIWRK